MPPNKNKKGAVAVADTSPEAAPSAAESKHASSSLSGDDGEDSSPRKGAYSQMGPSAVRALAFSGQRKPAELFRKDLISAMKLADKDFLPEESYYVISDPWRQEWEKGVQVPVNVVDMKQANVKELREKNKTGDFKMPHKLLHERADDVYKKGQHELSGMPELAEQLVRYDLDDLDVCWLEELNFRYREMGLNQITEWNMERVMEALENHCHEKMADVMKTAEGMGIEYDEDVVCDVCRSPESEETNEMVFCDKCDICVHQACYGIQCIPQGNWLCRTCAVGVKPVCMLCPTMGGAMKSTRSGTQWVHVSCALWIPEVSFGDPDKIEPITKISHIPPSRWSLVCCLCKEREGACIQCSVKSCKTAFHVTCAFNEGLQMKTILDEKKDSDNVKLKAFCPKHSKKRDRTQSDSEVDTPRKNSPIKDGSVKNSPRKGTPRKDSPRKDGPSTPRKDLTYQQREDLRSKKLKDLGGEFHKVVDASQVAKSLELNEEVISIIFAYWKLKRKCNWDKPLLTPRTEEEDILEKQEEDSRVARMKMFVHLRHDLERARNLCYMISKREKMKRQLYHNKEHVFKNMVRVLRNKSLHLSKANVRDIVKNYHFDSIYNDYGRSVKLLPGELAKEDNDSVSSETENGALDVGTEEKEKSGGEKESKTQAHSVDAMQSKGNAKNERSRGNHHKARRKGATDKKLKEQENQALASISETSVTSTVKGDSGDSEDNIEVVSADESEDDTVSRLPGTMALKAGTSWSDALPHSTISRRVRQKKPRRGRKPWYEKQNQDFELTPNLALSTDDDEDTKGSCSEGAGLVHRDTSEDSVVIDAEGEGGDSSQTPSSNPRSDTDRTCAKEQQSDSARDTSNLNSGKTKRTAKSGSIQLHSDRRTKSGNRGSKLENTPKSSKISCEMKCDEDSHNVLSPVRTSSRKRRKGEQNVLNVETENASEHSASSNHSEGAGTSTKLSALMEETLSPSPSKVRKNGRHQTKTEKVKTENDGLDKIKEVSLGPGAELTDQHQSDSLLSLNHNVKRRNLQVDSESFEDVQGKGRSCKTTVNSILESVKTERPETSDSEGRECRQSSRQGRKSSEKARLVWNKLLSSSSASGSRTKKQSQPPNSSHRKEVIGHIEKSMEVDKSSGNIKIKQEKDDEMPTENEDKKAQGDSSFQALKNSKTSSSKSTPQSSSQCRLNESVKNGSLRRRPKRGRRGSFANGILDNKQRKIDAFFAKVTDVTHDSEDKSTSKSTTKNRILNEIIPQKRNAIQNGIIPLPTLVSSRGSSVKAYNEKQKIGKGETKGGDGDHKTQVKTGNESSNTTECLSEGRQELDTVSSFTKGECEADPFSMDTMRAFRSQSPSSEASTITVLRNDSRESTPRRFTRSRLTDTAENSSYSKDSCGTNTRSKLRGHKLKMSS